MDEQQFLRICAILFAISFLCLCGFVLFTSLSALTVDAYSGELGCEGSCTFTGKLLAVTDKNATMFFQIERIVPVDTVLFVGMKKPAFVAGDCVTVRGFTQDYKGKQSVVISTINRASANCS